MKTPLHLGRYDYASFLALMAYAISSMIIPMVLYQLAKDMHFPLQDGGLGLGGALQLGRSIPMVISMLLCGFVAAKIGKAWTIGLSLLCMAAGIMSCSIAPGYVVLFFLIAFAGLGEGVVEGITTPFIQDQHPDEPGRYINFTHGFWSIGIFSVVLVAGWLLLKGVSWRYLVIGAGAFAILPAMIYLLPDRKKQLKEGTKGESFSRVLQHTVKILKTPRFWLFYAAMFLAGGGEYCLTFWTASYICLEFPGSDMLLAGIGTACFAGGMIVGRCGPGFFIKQHQLPALVIVTGIGAALLSLPFPWLTSLPLFFLLLFLSGVATGPFWPSVQSYSVDRMPQLDSTMIYVLLSCAGVPGCGFFTWLMGAAGDLVGIRYSFFLTPLCFIVMTFLIIIERKMKKPV